MRVTYLFILLQCNNINRSTRIYVFGRKHGKEKSSSDTESTAGSKSRNEYQSLASGVVAVGQRGP